MLCECGCGLDAGVYPRTRGTNSKGSPKRFLMYHDDNLGIKKNKIAQFVEENGLDINELDISKISLWESGNQTKTSVHLKPNVVSGPEWPVVQSANPVNVLYTPTRPYHSRRINSKTTVILPDPQIGYWRLQDGTMIPTYDELAMEVSLQIIELIRPNVIVNLGDFLDLSEFTMKFAIYPEFANTTQAAVDKGHRYLAEQKSAAGETLEEHHLLEGNHDDRIPRLIAANAKAAMRLHRADEPEGWPVMSVPNLLALDSLGVNYVSGYPAGRLKLAEKHDRQTALYALHGEKLDMMKQAKAERQSTIQGHTHHVSLHTEVYEDDGEPYEVESWSLGCLCATNGRVPSTKGAPDIKGIPVIRHESWTQAVGVLTETADNWELEAVRIRNGRAIFRGNEIG